MSSNVLDINKININENFNVLIDNNITRLYQDAANLTPPLPIEWMDNDGNHNQSIPDLIGKAIINQPEDINNLIFTYLKYHHKISLEDYIMILRGFGFNITIIGPFLRKIKDIRKIIDDNTIDDNDNKQIWDHIIDRVLEEKGIELNEETIFVISTLSIDVPKEQRTLDSRYNEWRRNIFIPLLEKTINRAKKINMIKSRLFDLWMMRHNDQTFDTEYGEIIINSSISAYQPTDITSNTSIHEMDGIDIFNTSLPSKYVPFIKYNNEFGKSFYKLYTNSKINTANYTHNPYKSNYVSNNYENIFLKKSKTYDPNTIYLNLWLGDPNNNGTDNVFEASKDMFFLVIYRLVDNFLTIKLPERTNRTDTVYNESIAVQRVKDVLPMLNFGKKEEIKVNAEYSIWNVDYEEHSLLYKILTDDIFSVFLYIDESTKAYAFKSRLDIRYKPMFIDDIEANQPSTLSYVQNYSTVIFNMIQNNNQNEAELPTWNPRVESNYTPKIYPPDIKFIQIKIMQANSREEINTFLRIFDLLLYAYKKEQIDVTNDINKHCEDLIQISKPTNKLNRKQQASTSSSSARSSSSSSMGNNAVNILTPGSSTPTTRLSSISSDSTTGYSGIIQARLENDKPTIEERQARRRFLEQNAPEIYIRGAVRKGFQEKGDLPLLIRKDDIEQWKKQKLPNGELREIMPFPKNNPKYYFVCDYNLYPYPGVKLNAVKENRAAVPVIPYCYKKPHSNNPTTAYYKYLRDQSLTNASGTKGKTLIKTKKIASIYGRALLPDSISKILKLYVNDLIGNLEIYGAPHDKNSFLHCVCIAIDDDKYLRLRTSTERETYVMTLRNNISSMVYTEIFKQELYDHSYNDILNMINDQTSFFDPDLFYRAVEDIFNVNIYVFTSYSFDNYSSRYDERVPTISLPRHRGFYSKPLNLTLPSILIYKTLGSESDKLEYPHCQLIVDYNLTNKYIGKIFGQRMTYACHDILQKNMYTYTFNIVNINNDNSSWGSSNNSSSGNNGSNGNGNVNNGGNIISKDSGSQQSILDIRKNIYYHIDYSKLLPNLFIIGQIIDEYGKLRALTYRINNNNSNSNGDNTSNSNGVATSNGEGNDNTSFEISDRLMTIFTQPSMPLNVRSLNSNVYNVLPSIDDVLLTVEYPIAGITKNSQNGIDGIWYQILDIKFGFYIPIIAIFEDNHQMYDTLNKNDIYKNYPLNDFKSLQKNILPHNFSNNLINNNSNESGYGKTTAITGSANNNFSDESLHNITNRYRKIKRDINLIVQVVKWAFDVFRISNDLSTIENVVKTFFDNYVVTNDSDIVVDSSMYYNLKLLPRKLPTSDPISIRSNLRQLLNNSNNSTGLLRYENDDVVLVMYNSEFRERMYKIIVDYDIFMRYPHPIQYLSNYYEYVDDFEKMESARVFLNENDITLWIQSITPQYNSLVFKTKITSDIKVYVYPYLYHDLSTNQLYNIQNVKSNEYAKAYIVADIWNRLNVNVGYNVDIDSMSPQEYNIYYDSNGKVNPDKINISQVSYIVYGISPSQLLVPLEVNIKPQQPVIKLLYYGSNYSSNNSIDINGLYAAMLPLN